MLRLSLVVSIGILFLPLLQAQGFSDKIEPFISLNEPVYALRNYTIIDGTGQPAQDQLTLVVREGKIEQGGICQFVDL